VELKVTPIVEIAESEHGGEEGETEQIGNDYHNSGHNLKGGAIRNVDPDRDIEVSESESDGVVVMSREATPHPVRDVVYEQTWLGYDLDVAKEDVHGIEGDPIPFDDGDGQGRLGMRAASALVHLRHPSVLDRPGVDRNLELRKHFQIPINLATPVSHAIVTVQQSL